MNFRPILTSLVLAAAFAGCATYTKTELGQIRQHGVSPAVVGKLEDGRVLTPQDVIELTRRGVADELIIRQIQDASVDYVLNRSDLKQLSAAHVSRPVVDALIAESEDFARDHSPSGRPRVAVSYGGYPYDYYPAPYPYYYPYGGVYIGGGYGYYGHRHWR